MRETTHTLPPATIDKFAQLAELLKQASLLAREISQSSERLSQSIPEDQRWFWTDVWQATEHEVDEQLARGEYDEFDSMEAVIADLHSHV